MSERDPVDVAREVWPLEWETTSWGGAWAMLGPLHVTISTELLGPAWMGEPTVVVRGADNKIYHAPLLADALDQARRETLEHLKDGAALCHEDDGPTREDLAEVIRLMAREGHTEHCAKGIVYSGQECECGKSRGPEYHTMNPPPGGFKMDAQAWLWSDLFLLVRAVSDYRDAKADQRGAREVFTMSERMTKRLQHAAQTLERTKSKTPVPVYIAKNGEHILMLTSSNRGHVIPVPVRVIVDGVDGVSPMYERQSSPSRVETRDGMEGRTYIVRETVEDIQATLVMLAKREGGEK